MDTPKLGHDPKKIKSTVQHLSLEDLWKSLEYVEKIAEGARSRTEHILRQCKERELDPKENFADELGKLWQIFEEHNDYSFIIEKQLDAKMKSKLKNRYTTKTLMDVGQAIEEKFRDLFAEKAESEKKDEVQYK